MQDEQCMDVVPGLCSTELAIGICFNVNDSADANSCVRKKPNPATLLQLKSTEAIDQAFAGLSAAERSAVADHVEKCFLQGIEKDKDEFRQKGPAAIKLEFQTKQIDLATLAEYIKRQQLSIQLFSKVREIKGKNTSPFMKAFVKAAAKLTDEEYNGIECIAKPLNAVIDAVAKKEGLLKPNPLRQKNARQP